MKRVAGLVSLLATALLMGVVSGSPASAGGTPGPDGSVTAVATMPDGRIVIGGTFATVSGAALRGVARLNGDGTVDPSFSGLGAGFDGHVQTLAVLPDSRILVGGEFSHVDGMPVKPLVRLNPDGSLDGSFTAGKTPRKVRSIAVQPDGAIVVGGWAPNQAYEPNLVRLNADGSPDASFTPDSHGGEVRAVAVLPSGDVIAGFTGSDKPLQAYDSAGTSSIIAPQAYGASVNTLAVQPDGKYLAAGDLGGQDLLRLKNAVFRDTSFRHENMFDPGVPWSLAVQADGKVLVGGSFTSIEGLSARGLARLNGDGTRDDSFNLPAPGFEVAYGNANVQALAVQPDGRILVGGDFSRFAGEAAHGLIRLNADGSRDSGFLSSPAVNPTPEVQVPPKPERLRVKANTARVRATWRGSDGAMSYRVVVRGKKSKVVSGTSVRIPMKLKARTKVRVCVVARNDAGASAKACEKVRVRR